MTVRIAGVQMDIAWEDPTANLERADTYVAEAAKTGARVVVLPEMFATGFSMNSLAMAAHAPAVRAWVGEASKRHGVWLLAGFAEPGSERPRNAAALYDPEGAEQLRYHKVHPFSLAREDEHFEGGTMLPTADVEGIRVTALVCYDLRFPELFRARSDETDLFVVIANWPEPRRMHWSTLLRARAIEAQAYVLGVNRVGSGDTLSYVGDSVLLDPLGETVATAGEAAGVFGGEVDAGAVAAARAKYSFLADRKPEVYRWL